MKVEVITSWELGQKKFPKIFRNPSMYANFILLDFQIGTETNERAGKLSHDGDTVNQANKLIFMQFIENKIY